MGGHGETGRRTMIMVAIATSIRYDTASHKFQLKKTTVRIIEKADEDANWTDIVALTEYDDT